MGQLPSVSDGLLEALPDLLIVVRRDGVVLGHAGGWSCAPMRPLNIAVGQALEAVWPAPVASLLRQLTHKAIASRATTEARLTLAGCPCEVRVSPLGPERVACVVRSVVTERVDALETSDELRRPHLNRRGFLHRFKESMGVAALREKPMALAVVHVDGVADIAQIIATKVAEQIMSAAILRLPPQGAEADGTPSWYLGQLNDNLLALVLETSDRDAIEACVERVCASLREPVDVAASQFHLTPYAGVAILGQDASSPKTLLEHARAAAAEARRTASDRVCFFTDTLQLQSLARLDIARELSEAIVNRDIRLRYVGRHDLASGRLSAWVGYLRWQHPLRGEIRPVEFLRIAETTGLATALSRAMLAGLAEDLQTMGSALDPDVRISFGALRHHILHEDFVDNIRALVSQGGMPVERLELRISEKTFIAHEPTNLHALARMGIRLVVDEVARDVGSLDALARAPLWGLQLDRAWVTALRSDPVALKVCRAGISIATALGLTPIVTGVDNEAQRELLLELGCRLGAGDLFQAGASDIKEPIAASVR